MAGRNRTRRRGKGEGSILQRKDGTWQGAVTVGYTDAGKQKRKTVYGKTQAEVLDKLAEVRQQLRDGTYSDTDKTVKAYLNEWLEVKARTVKPRTAELYRQQAERYVYPRMGRVKLAKLTPLQVQTLVSELAEEIGPSTANKVRTLLFQAMKQAVKWQLAPRNIVEAVDKLKETHKEMRIWTSQQAAHFLDAIQGHRLYALFYLAMSTGMRRGELLGLRWQDVKADALTIRQALVSVGNRAVISTPKTAKGQRRVAISPDVTAVLEAHKQRQRLDREALGDMWPETDLVFTSEVGTPISPHNLERTWKALQEAAGVPHVRLHDLRHLHASLMIKNGCDAKVLADRLGHARASFTLDVYTHLFEEQRKAAAVSLTDLLGGQAAQRAGGATPGQVN